VCSSDLINCKTAQYLIAKYPTPEDYDFLRVEELCNELRKVSRGKFGKKQAEALLYQFHVELQQITAFT